ncbi:MAG: glycosyltransferase family 2 protein [Henriciella sp.]|uniref:glycosyltransferase family 2 protein n=1 Tax=Henriciella sp. TaxID=1968823 RepID=UPI003C70993C
MSAAQTTAIVVSYKTGPRLRECLFALAYDPAIRDVLVVDNGNGKAETAWLGAFAAKRDHVTILAPGSNIGFGAGVNFAAASVDSGDLLIINPDAVLKRGSVEAMRTAGNGLKTPWIIGGKVFDVSGCEVRGPRRRKLTLWRALTSFAGWNTWTLEDTPAPDKSVPMDVVSGALMLISKAGFDQLGGFDETYFLHVEDVDLCRRAWEAGGEVIYCPEAGALHYGSTSDVPSAEIARHKADSLIHYFRKFASNPLERLAVRAVAPALKGAVSRKASGR